MALTFNPANVAKVKKAMKAALNECEAGALQGAYRGGLKIQRLAQQRVPVEYGNLRASAFTRIVRGGVEVGFTAEYAVFVHENMNQKWKGQPRRSGLGVYWGPSGEPKFLEKSVNELQGEFLDDVARGASSGLGKGAKAT